MACPVDAFLLLFLFCTNMKSDCPVCLLLIDVSSTNNQLIIKYQLIIVSLYIHILNGAKSVVAISKKSEMYCNKTDKTFY